MPVPVPTQDRLPVYLVSKLGNDIQDSLPLFCASKSICDNSSKYVIQSARQPIPSEAGFSSLSYRQGSRSNWPVNNPFSFCVGAGPVSVRPASSDFRRGLIVADNVAISKQAHAEACCSPVQESNPRLASMGLQHVGDLRTSDSCWERCDVDVPRYSCGFASRSDAVNFDSDIGPRIHYAEDTMSNSRLHYGATEQLCDSLLPSGVTPFADFVDRIVATEVANTDSQLAVNAVECCTQPDSPRCQQVDPLSNPSYIRSYRAMAEPLSEWMADYVWKICTAGISLPRRFVGAGYAIRPRLQERFTQAELTSTPRRLEEKPSALAKSIHSVLCSTLLQPSAIVLALWYITRLPVFFDGQATGLELTASELEFRKELYGEARFHAVSEQRNQIGAGAPFRVALLGCMLANKWLDDHTFSNKTWQTISEVPIQSINRLELAALDVLGHDLTIAPKAWESWLTQLQQHQLISRCFPAPICRPSAKDSHAIVRKMIMDLSRLHHSGAQALTRSTALPVFSPLLMCDIEKTSQPFHTRTFDPFEVDLDEDGPLREEYVPKRRSSASNRSAYGQSSASDRNDAIQTSPFLPPPSEWSPDADPLFHRDWRCRDNAYANTVGAPEIAPRGCSFPGYSQASAWNLHAGVECTGFSLPPSQMDSRNEHTNYRYHPTSLGFPVSVVCPPTSHARTTSSSAIRPTHASAHVRSCSQSHGGTKTNHCFPPVTCSQFVGHPVVFPRNYGDVEHFRPLWLKT